MRLLAAALACFFGLSAHAADITVSAAASLTNAFKDLAPIFEAAHPGDKLRFNFGASGALRPRKTAISPYCSIRLWRVSDIADHRATGGANGRSGGAGHGTDPAGRSQ